MKTLENGIKQGPPDWNGPWEEVIAIYLRHVAGRLYWRWKDDLGRRNPMEGLDMELAKELVGKIRGNPRLWWTNKRVKEEIKLMSGKEKKQLLAVVKSIAEQLAPEEVR